MNASGVAQAVERLSIKSEALSSWSSEWDRATSGENRDKLKSPLMEDLCSFKISMYSKHTRYQVLFSLVGSLHLLCSVWNSIS
jgi:hypothetical protein